MRTVLLDLTALNTRRRLHGVGRHVRELINGLARLPESERAGLRLLGVAGIDLFGNTDLIENLADFPGIPENREPTLFDDERVRWSRRAGIWRAASRVRADLLHVPDPNVTPWAIGRGPRRVATCHDLASLRPQSRSAIGRRGVAALRRSVEARRFRNADHVIAISSYTAEDLRQLFGLDSSRVSVVYNGVDLSKWVPRDDHQIDDGVLTRYGLRDWSYALYVGDAGWRKNRSGMLRALRRAREMRSDIGLQLAWAGKLSQGESSAIDREARNLGIRHAVHLLNFVTDEELSSLYRRAAAHLFVSRHEGFGLTVIEAMACGCPVITTRRTALAEVAGDAAVHVEPEEHQGIAEALVRVATDVSLREDLRRRGLARAEVFSSERQARETVQIYRRVLGL